MMGYALQLCLVALLFANVFGVGKTQAVGPLFSVVSGATINPFLYDGAAAPIDLEHPFVYAGKTYSKLYLGMNGFVSFTQPLDDLYPDPHFSSNIVAPLWIIINNTDEGNISYIQATEGSLITQATDALNGLYDKYNSSVTWVFVATWLNIPLELESANVTFQVVLITVDTDESYVLMNYGDIPSFQEIWLAGFGVENKNNFLKLPVKDSSALTSASNFGIPGRWVFSVYLGPKVNFFPILPEANSSHEAFVSIDLEYPLVYNGRNYSQLYLDWNGFVSFFEPPLEFYPNSYVGQDMIAPFWFDIKNKVEGLLIYYEQATDGPLIAVATDAVKQAFPDTDFEEVVWVFVATWNWIPLEFPTVDVSFQVVLISDVYKRSYVLMNYGNFPSLSNIWLAGFAFNYEYNFSNLSVNSSSVLSSTSNIGFDGRWAFETPDNCERAVQCTQNEMCVKRSGIYGCKCADANLRPNPQTFDATEACSGSSGTVSLSRCQLFEAGYSAQYLHLSDHKCKGVIQGDRVVFSFDYHEHNCGTVLLNNATHFMYKNKIEAIMEEEDQTVISRDKWLSIDISCVYPLTESISMPMSIQVMQSVIMKDLPTEGEYEIHMIPYPDASFTSPHSNNVTLQLNDPLFVAVDVIGVNSTQVSILLDRCWATPVYDMNYNISWNLIINECPNPEDGTVQVLQNGVSTSGRFSFKMFTFTSVSPYVFLHCQVHLCLVESGECAQPCGGDPERRRRRSLDFHDTVQISMSI